MFRSFLSIRQAGQNRDPPKITTPERKKTLFWCKGSSKAREEMAIEPEPEHSALRFLQHISDLLPKEEQADVSDTNFVDAPINIYASPEEASVLYEPLSVSSSQQWAPLSSDSRHKWHSSRIEVTSEIARRRPLQIRYGVFVTLFRESLITCGVELCNRSQSGGFWLSPPRSPYR